MNLELVISQSVFYTQIYDEGHLSLGLYRVMSGPDYIKSREMGDREEEEEGLVTRLFNEV